MLMQAEREMGNRQSETYHQAKERLNAALKEYGLRVDCMMPWHYQAWDLYRRQGNAWVPVMTEAAADVNPWLRRVMPKVQKKASFPWDAAPEDILAWAREHRVIDVE
jgi:hypothetical protein